MCDSISILPVLAATLLTGLANAAGPAHRVTITDRTWHLGRTGNAEWTTFEQRTPDAARLELSFAARRNENVATLFVRQDDVRHDWFIELNGRRLGRLFLMEADLVNPLPIPAGGLRDGTNRLVIVPPSQVDDILLGEIWLKQGDLSQAIGEATLLLRASESPGGRPAPARITIVDSRGTLAPLTLVSNSPADAFAAVRPGVVYLGSRSAAVGLPAGEYTAYASRGFEYGVQVRKVHLALGETKTVEFALHREVPTAGWVAADTHVHTATHSGHGDASVDERMLTLAGEGIELPIATDHNYHADYRDAAERMGVRAFFTPVGGNEVTTSTAHFNIFPVQPADRVVDFRIGGGAPLAAALRSIPGVKVVILNHPLNVHNGFQPFAPTNFNRVTGEHLGGPKFLFNGIELLSSSAQQSDFMTVFRGWFALLNHGHRIAGVGSSDGHDVSRYIVGQSRTYLASWDADPGNIDVGRACEALLAGRALVSMGLLVNLKVNETSGVGDLATNLAEEIDVTAQVLGPSWTEATNVVLFANGRPVFEQAIHGSAGRAGEKARVRWRLARPVHDVHLIGIATGPGVTAPYWAIPRPYQATSRHWESRVIGATNPIWLDADGDGQFTAARGYAQRLMDRHGTDVSRLIAALAEYDEAVAAQTASLLHTSGTALDDASFRKLLVNSTEPVRIGFRAFSEALAASRQ